MQDEVYTAFKEKLGDFKIKVGDDEIFAYEAVKSWEDSASVKEKIQEINKDLTGQRELSTKELAALKMTISDKDKEIEMAVKNSLTDEQKKIIEDHSKGNTVAKSVYNDLQTKLNSYEIDMKNLTKSIDDKDRDIKGLNDTNLNFKKSVAIGNLQAELIGKLGGNANIIGKAARHAAQEIIDSGNIALEQLEGGDFERKYYVTIDGKQCQSNFDNVIKNFVDNPENAYLIPSSAKPGSGQQHNNGTPQSEFNPLEHLNYS